jgi:hypothetical protein
MTALCPWCHAAPVSLTWPSRIDCEREHRPFGSTENEKRILRDYEHQKGQWDDGRVGPRPMSSSDKASMGPVDLLLKGVKDRALVRAIDRTAR